MTFLSSETIFLRLFHTQKLAMCGIAIDITDKLSAEAAMTFAQWIGGANVVRNQKIAENNASYKAFVNGKGDKPDINQKASHITNKPELAFLKDIPSQIRRNAATTWHNDMQALFNGLRKAPRIKGKRHKRSCYLTSELFTIDKLNEHECMIRVRKSAKKHDVSNYLFLIRMPFPQNDSANSLRISRQGRRFWLSMAYRKEFDVLSENAIRESLSCKSADELAELTHGYDIGVVRQVTSSSGRVFHLQNDEIESMEKLEIRKRRYQRRYARMSRTNDKKAGTKNRKRTGNEKVLSQKIAQMDAKRARIRFNASHHISKAIAEDAPMVAGFEDINLKNLTRRPKAKQCAETGKWLRNNAKAKAGLNRAILNLSLGQIRTFSQSVARSYLKCLRLIARKNAVFAGIPSRAIVKLRQNLSAWCAVTRLMPMTMLLP